MVSGVQVAGRGDRLGGEVRDGFGEFVVPLDVVGERAGVGELLLDEDLGERGEQQGVGAGPDGGMPVGEPRGAGAARVDDGEGAAALARSALSLPGKSGAVHRLPLDSSGLAPIRSRWSVRSRSGTGMAWASPKSSPLETCLGIWSRVLAVKTLRVPSVDSSSGG